MIPLINHDSSEGEQWGRYNLPWFVAHRGEHSGKPICRIDVFQKFIWDPKTGSYTPVDGLSSEKHMEHLWDFKTRRDGWSHGQALTTSLPRTWFINAGFSIYIWLVVLTSLKNDGVRQWEGYHPIYEMENKKMFETTNHIYINTYCIWYII